MLSKFLGLGTTIERDAQLVELENNVFGQLSKIKQQITEDNDCCSCSDIQFVSFEDALKELITLKEEKS